MCVHCVFMEVCVCSRAHVCTLCVYGGVCVESCTCVYIVCLWSRARVCTLCVCVYVLLNLCTINSHKLYTDLENIVHNLYKTSRFQPIYTAYHKYIYWYFSKKNIPVYLRPKISKSIVSVNSFSVRGHWQEARGVTAALCPLCIVLNFDP